MARANQTPSATFVMSAQAGLSIWQRPFMQNVLPFLTSLAFHTALLVVVLAAYKVIIDAPPNNVEQVTVPTSDMLATLDRSKGIGGVLYRGVGGENQDAQQNIMPKPDLTGWDPQGRGHARSGRIMPASVGEAEAGETASIISISDRPARSRRVGNTAFSGEGEGGPWAPFGPVNVPGGRPNIFKSPFPGDDGDGGGGPLTVVYVCDASGSMLAKFDDLRIELRKAVSGLRPSQSFNIIFFQGEKTLALSDRQLLVNKPESRDKAIGFLENVVPGRDTNPIPALEMALRQGPRLIWLLTDGDFPDNDAVVKFLRQRNTNKQTRINTIAYVDRGEAYEKVLKQIAAENGGIFRYVSEKDLGN